MAVQQTSTKRGTVDTFLDYLRDYFASGDALPKQTIASDAGISRMYLYDLLNGVKTEVSLSVASRLANAMGTSLAKILETTVSCS